MVYVKQQWATGRTDPPYGPINGERLQHIEDGLEAIANGGSVPVPAAGTPLDHALRDYRRRQIKGWTSMPTIASSPPTLTAGVASAASAITGSALTPWWDTASFEYEGTVPASSATGQTDDGYSNPASVAVSVYPSGHTSAPPWAVEFDFWSSDGQFEISSRGSGQGCRVIVDGQAAGALASFTHTANGSGYLDLVSELSAGWHRIRIEFEPNYRFRGIQCLPTNAVAAARSRSQRWIVIGDSFTEPTIDDSGGTFTYLGWVQRLGYLLGVDAWSAGKGSTGYLNPGTHVKFRDRLSDITDNNPDVIVWAGGINDYANYTAAAIGAEALACFQAAAAALPGVQQIVLSPFWPRGFSTFSPNLLATADAIEASAEAAGAIFLDLLRMPFPDHGINGANTDGTPASTTLAADAAAGVNTISANAQYATKTYIQIGTGSNAEVRQITGKSGTGPYSLQFGTGGGNLANSHVAGETVAPIGHSYMTGTGKQGATVGDGISDVFTGNGGTHPTMNGHRYIADIVARLLSRAISA